LCQGGFKHSELVTRGIAFGFNGSDALPEVVDFAAQLFIMLGVWAAVTSMPAAGALHGVLDFVVTGISPILSFGTQRLNPRKRLQLSHSVIYIPSPCLRFPASAFRGHRCPCFTMAPVADINASVKF
jgi:hypothetical protein